MSSYIERGGKLVRPHFNFIDHEEKTPSDSIAAQMLESIRNVLEDIHRSQMLQCDVAHAIKDTRDILRNREREESARYLHRNGFKEAAAKLRKRKK